MVSAILYTSNTGFTARYAKMLGEKTGLPVYDLAGRELPASGSEVIYLGWLMAGSVKGLNKAVKRWSVPCICAVGMGQAEAGQGAELEGKYSDKQVFYLEGGYDHGKLRGIYKLMMNTMRAAMKGKPADDEQTRRMLDAMEHGGDWVREENLQPVLAWLAR